MALLPRSPKARRRLMLVAVIAPVLVAAVALTLWAMREQVTYFYSPAQAAAQGVAPGVNIRLGGLVEIDSVRHGADGEVRFIITDGEGQAPVRYRGDLPDLFREGQGVVVQGAFDAEGTFVATQVLAKHDETYMPREVSDALKAQGEWRPEATLSE